MGSTLIQNKKINHVALVIDESGSIEDRRLTKAVIDVVDGQVAWLSQLSKDMDQETRVSIYTFSGKSANCVVYDTDVLRLPSLRDHYRPAGGTPMISGTLKAIEDLEKTAQLYGDHGFLIFVITDGEENTSAQATPFGTRSILTKRLAGLGANWTVGALVPDFQGKLRAQGFGFDPTNIAIWNATSVGGVSDAGEDIKAATTSYFTTRSTGGSTRTGLFTGLVVKDVTAADVAATGMKPIDPSEFIIVPVALASTSTLEYVIPKKSITKANPHGVKHVEIMPFVQETGRRYIAGNAFYKLTKSERYDYQKDIVLIHRVTKKVYRGDACKKLIGLDGTSTRIKPQPVKGGEYDVYVQSTSVNRHLEVGGQVLLFHK